MKRAFGLLACALALGAAADERKSGAQFMGASTQAMQRDDTLNPAMLWVGDGEAQWQAKAGRDGKSCASCHGDASAGMRGVAARFPAFDTHSKLPINLAQRINQCRVGKQKLPPWRPESRELLAMEAYVALQSRGMPVAPPRDARLKQPTERGKQLFNQRIGQLNLSCAQCHDANWGKRLAGSTIPQGHASAYPIYRLEWQDMGSLQRRLRNCMSGVRAEVPPYGALELVELELYLAARARGMAMESPGVRP
ncbi:sulfur oxidation c-type cytochrome SoxA [Massilia soli]|uniref:L-cysteine S-thiosulfotransferase subunit SoxA n=1 Tax=Massilia soli TaxID=2792854 RepID=A0ABS7SUG6_9BURK|nr:sulfur oxidation c-type cytochrome SoxA [Massilia soli]MBZ2209575.1 sulfur oxidation c-type cytochrome SoxA [Massilia soli]